MYFSARIFFQTPVAAAECLLLVIEDARVTPSFYQFGPVSTDQVFQSGLILVGEITEILSSLEKISGTTVYVE